jgi:phage terminase large subunit
VPLVGPNGIDLSTKQTEAWKLLLNRSTTRIFFGGGAGASKSTLGCLWQIFVRAKYPGTRGFIGRDTYKELRDSTMATFFEVVRSLNYLPVDDYTYNAQDENIYWSNGSETHFRYMQFKPSDPDFHRFGSTEYTDAFVDEAPGVDKRAVQVLESRLRYKHVEYDLIPKLLLTGNPGDHWVKHDFVFDIHGNHVELPDHVGVVLATIKDHPDAEFRERYIRTLENLDPYDRARLLDGDWLVGPRTGNEFFHEFDTGKHARKVVPYRADLPLHMTLDFNAHPYMTLLVYQISKGSGRYIVQGLKEYCLEHPYNTTKSACEALLHELLNGVFKGHKAGLFCYGDYSGKKSDPMARDGIRHNYDIVELVLGRWLTDFRLRPNPLHIKARGFMNAIFAGKLNVDIYVDPAMSNTVRDFTQVKQDVDGGMLKETAIDRATGVRYEKVGHCSQATYYMVCSAFGELFDNFA